MGIKNAGSAPRQASIRLASIRLVANAVSVRGAPAQPAAHTCSLARSGFGHADDVATRERNRNRLFLNGGRLCVAVVGDVAQERVVEAKVGKGGARARHVGAEHMDIQLAPEPGDLVGGHASNVGVLFVKVLRDRDIVHGRVVDGCERLNVPPRRRGLFADRSVRRPRRGIHLLARMHGALRLRRPH